MRKLSELIKLDKYTNKIQEPSLMLMTRNLDVIGKISKYTNWNTSFVGNGLDEISFEVHKYNDGKLCPVWDDLIDLKIINVDDYKNFEIQVEYTDSTETIKSVHGISLEAELGQLYLYDFHVNDEEATSAAITEYNKEDFDENNKFIPTVLCSFDDPKHSLLHRVLKDKAPHWSIGEVTGYVSLSEDDKAELTERFQRTYTVDGETIYDFLTGTVAKESNVIFVFDTIERKINCYSLCDCYITVGDTKEKVGITIGEDTKVLISKKKLANEISISSNKDSVKNCFRIEGGDDVITDMVRAVNMNGSNYIYQFADFQYNDMPENLVDAIKSYQAKINNTENQEKYYGENGIFTRLCDAYKQLAYLQSEKMPAITNDEEYPKTAEIQYNNLKEKLSDMTIGVSSVNNYNGELFVGVTNNVEAMAQILIDSRYKLEVIKGTTSYNDETQQWTGTIQIARVSDETDYYPKAVDGEYFETITVSVNDDKSDPLNLPYTRQKIDKALAKGDMSLVDYDADQLYDEDPEIDRQKKYDYFNQYCQRRLQSFLDGYNSCLSVLMSGNIESDIKDELYKEYNNRYVVVEAVLEKRNDEVADVEKQIGLISEEQIEFQKELDFYTYLENVETGLYEKFCAYRREDTYSNSNYISDGIETTDKLIEKAQELLKVAETELKKACVLQRTVSASLNNLFALKEFEPLYDSFDLFNYIRIQTEDEILKLRLIGVDVSGDSISDINVTFSEQIETVDGNMTDLESIIQQAASIASSYSSTTLQAKQGSEAKNTFLDIYNNGLNAANMMLKNSDNNEVTITSSGILCKRMDDEGFYGNKQLRFIGNGIYMTEDAWATLSMAVGEINFNGKDVYGVIAEAIVGEMIVGNNLIIGNDNNVIIDEDGITIYDGKYTEETAKKVFYADTEGNLNLEAYIYAKGGKIGGLNVDENSLSYSVNSFESLPLDTSKNEHYYEENFIYSRQGRYFARIARMYLNKNIYKFYLLTQTSSISYNTPEEVIPITWDETEYSGNNLFRGYLGDDKAVYDDSSITSYTWYYDIEPYSECIVFNNSVFYYLSTESFEDSTSNESDGIVGGDGISSYYRDRTTFCTDKDGNGTYLYLWSDLYSSGDVPSVGRVGIVNTEELIQSMLTSLKSAEKQGEVNAFTINDQYFDLGDCLSFNLFTNQINLHNIVNNITPKSDNLYSLGQPNLRWNSAYCASGVITTSDKNQKTDINYDIDKYTQLLDLLKPCSFRYIGGNSNRIHIGYIAQDVESAMELLGMSIYEFAGLCRDVLPNGQTIYSLRYDAFEGIYHAKINQQQLEIDALKESVSFLIQEINELKKDKEE